MNTYSTATAAAKLRTIGISSSTVRNYAADPRIAPLLSDAAHPGEGKQRRFCDADLTVIASIYKQVKQGISIDDAAARARDGVLLEPPTDSYRQPATNTSQEVLEAAGEPEEPQPEPATDTTTAIVLRSLYEAQQALWERTADAEARAAAAEALVDELRRQLADAQRPLWKKLLGQH